MSKCKIQLIILLILGLLFQQARMARANTWRLEKGQQLKPLSAEGEDKFLLEVAQIKKLINTGQTKAVRQAFDKLKNDFPQIAGPDLEAFIQAEILYSEGKFIQAVRAYDKFLTQFPESHLAEAAWSRQFDIATAFLAGHRKKVLRLLKIKGFAEGLNIMEKITDHAGLDTPIGLKAAVAVANSYEQTGQFNEAYLKWREISAQWQTGQIAKDALLGMARCKHALYNKHDQNKRALYDDSPLLSAKGYYRKFKAQYPQDANQIGVDKILKQIEQQLAYKQFTIGQYYQKTGNIQPANLYYDMVINNWPNTNAAKMAKKTKEKLLKSLITQEPNK